MRISDIALSVGTVLNPLELEILLSHVLKKPKEFVLAHPEFAVPAASARIFRTLCQKRSRGIPIAYLTHHREFYGLDFYVDERVLIPRPETELLVEEALFCLQRSKLKAQTPQFILDIGTGSGCIAVSLAKHLPSIRILAVDISFGAFTVARKNAKTHGVLNRIEFLQSDLLENFAQSRMVREFSKDRSVFGIVANLPYIGLSENHLVSREVADHEPREALFGGETGLELFEKLFAQIHSFIQNSRSFRPAWLIAEMGFSQKRPIASLLKKYFGNARVMWKNDLAGLPRIFIVEW